MSSICGIVSLNGKPVALETLEAMMAALAHRGIDGSGTWREGPTAFGHQMLLITPESLSEKLPFFDPQARLAINADARIDNRQDLFRQLEIPASRQDDISDSSLILAA
jgi:asparagine synthase (glutamine-hydrolysing)